MNKTRAYFESNYINSFWDYIRYSLLRRKVKREKNKIIFEAYLDKMFLEDMYSEDLAYSDSEDRKVLAAESTKPLADQDKDLIDKIEFQISKAKSIKKMYKDTEILIQENNHYIKMLDTWNKTESQN